MKHYKSPTNEVWAYELDGSQDNLIPEDFIAITDEEAATIAAEKLALVSEPEPAPPTKEELMTKLLEIQAQLETM